jgi:hypothetical protein
MMRLMIKRVLIIITLERWTVRWDKTPMDQLQMQRTVRVTALETIRLLPEDHPEEFNAAQKDTIS